MKKLMSLILLAMVFIAGESFTGNKTVKTDPVDNSARYYLDVDAAPFDARETSSYSARIINNSHTASITLIGKDVTDKAGHSYPTKIQIDYTLRGDALGEVNVEKVTYQYNNQTYNLLSASAFMSITKMKWAADKRSFTVCADVFCKVQKEYVMEEFVPVFVIRGQLLNLTVTAPAS